MTSVIAELKNEGRYGTAHIYQSPLNAFSAFVGKKEFGFELLTPRTLKQFEHYLRNRQRKWNTISTYMRMLRATYNRASDQGIISEAHRIFKGVYTGIERRRKLALTASEMYRLVYASPRHPLPEAVSQSRDYLRLMLELQGMPFTDLAHLHVSDLQEVPCYPQGTKEAILSCHRQKTNQPLEITVARDTLELIRQHRPTDAASPYLLDILNDSCCGEEEYDAYQQTLRKMNRNLKRLARIQGVGGKISSYTARHTWATLAKFRGITNELICDALGHTSVRTTEIYLKAFESNHLKRANRKIISYIKGAVTL